MRVDDQTLPNERSPTKKKCELSPSNLVLFEEWGRNNNQTMGVEYQNLPSDRRTFDNCFLKFTDYVQKFLNIRRISLVCEAYLLVRDFVKDKFFPYNMFGRSVPFLNVTCRQLA